MEITVRPIHDEEDYNAALAEIDALMATLPGTPEGERLDVLVTLVEVYEARHWPIDTPDPIDAIRVRMEQKQLRQRDLEAMIGSRSRVSEILSRKRALTLPMIRRLSQGLDLRADILIQETPALGQAPDCRDAGGAKEEVGAGTLSMTTADGAKSPESWIWEAARSIRGAKDAASTRSSSSP